MIASKTTITPKLIDIDDCEVCHGVHRQLQFQPVGRDGDVWAYRARCPAAQRATIVRRFRFDFL